jgi:hypothetical protein
VSEARDVVARYTGTSGRSLEKAVAVIARAIRRLRARRRREDAALAAEAARLRRSLNRRSSTMERGTE